MDTCNLCDLITALENLLCVCTKLDEISEAVSLDVGLAGALPLLEDQYPSSEDRALVDNTGLPGSSAELCELANTVWGWGTEVITEKVLPLGGELSNKLALLIIATDVFVILTGGIGLPAAVAVALFTSLVRWLAEGAIANVENWIAGSGQEAVCALYTGFVDGGWDLARDRLSTMIDDEVQLTAGDKIMLKWFLTSKWVMQALQYSIDSLLLDPDDYFAYSCYDCGLDILYTFDGAPCPSDDFLENDCYDDAVAIDVAKVAETTPDMSLVTGTIQVRVLASGYNGYGGEVLVDLVQGTNHIDSDSFTVTTSSETQEFYLEFDIPGDGSTYSLYFYQTGTVVARILKVDVLVQE